MMWMLAEKQQVNGKFPYTHKFICNHLMTASVTQIVCMVSTIDGLYCIKTRGVVDS
jgi:hypothetical protein